MPAMNKPIMCDSFNWENERSTVVAFKTGTAEKDIQLLGQLSSAMIWHEPCSQFKTIEINIDVFIYLNCVGFLNAKNIFVSQNISSRVAMLRMHHLSTTESFDHSEIGVNSHRMPILKVLSTSIFRQRYFWTAHELIEWKDLVLF